MPSFNDLIKRRSSCGSSHWRLRSKCFLPVEVLDEVVAFILAEEHTFFSIANLAFSSHQFRQITLRRFFARLRACSGLHWIRCCQISGIFTWVRILECSSKTLTSQPALLFRFDHLRVVEIDCSPDGLATQSNRMELITKHLPSLLTELRLIALPRIDTFLLALIASRFAALEMLDLTCAERLDEDCCLLCYEESVSCALHSPVPDIYGTSEGLSVVFATALQPLRRLEHLFLGICLSDLDLLYEQFSHRDDYGAFGPDQCPICIGKHSTIVRKRELVASAVVARSLTSLRTISWSTFFAEDHPGDNPQARVTTVWIRRGEGAVRVRRAPW